MEIQTPDHGAPVQTNITAETGGTTCAPVIDGNTVQGSLTVINSIYGGEGCAALVKALKSNPSPHLRKLKLSVNKLGYSGVKELSDLLEDPHCKLEKLQLYDCKINGEGCTAQVKALESNPLSHLIELNLSWNKLGDSSVKKLCDLLEDPHCKLKKLQ
ncbi:ribonuclease inhibitor-like [Colossoma macropomum]|uniref:ribonuclease inhibitor-like n=1 Tax=Colossoma macropomum TaxID=42526 RepID=UPI001864038A|nr:ribonuclease inhibitor-like [Colossoma macropomum]